MIKHFTFLSDITLLSTRPTSSCRLKKRYLSIGQLELSGQHFRHTHVHSNTYIFVSSCMFVSPYSVIFIERLLVLIYSLMNMHVEWPGRPGFNHGLSHTKDSKIVHDTFLLNLYHYLVQFKGKWNNQWKEIAPSITPLCSIYCKWSLQITLEYGGPT